MKTIAGSPGRIDAAKYGLRENAWFPQQREQSDDCLKGPLLSGPEVEEKFPVTRVGRMDPVSQVLHLGEVVHHNIFTIQAGRAIKINAITGNVSLVYDFCTNGYFTMASFHPGYGKSLGEYDDLRTSAAASGQALADDSIRLFMFMQVHFRSKGHTKGSSQVFVQLHHKSGATAVTHYNPISENGTFAKTVNYGAHGNFYSTDSSITALTSTRHNVQGVERLAVFLVRRD